MHDELFARQKEISAELFPQIAKTLGLDLQVFERCLSSGSSARIAENMDEARRLGITGTPTILVGTHRPDGRVTVRQRLSGTLGVEAFSKIVDPLLSRTGANVGG